MDEVKNIHFDELLSETVQKFPCLYDKTKSDYKDRNVCRNAWATVSQEVEIENGERAKKLLYNLKKRFSKRRNDFKKAERSGTSTAAVAKCKEQLAEFNFLTWLAPFIRHRATKTNITDVPNPTNAPLSDVDNEDINEEESHEENSSDEEDEDENQDLEEDFEHSEKEKSKESSSQSAKKSAVKRRTKDVKIKHVKMLKKNQLDIAEMKFLKSMEKLANVKESSK